MKRIDEAFLIDILEGRTARKTNEKMGNKEGGTNATLDGKPEDESEIEGEAELDAEDTMEAANIGAADKAGTKTADDEEEVQEDDSGSPFLSPEEAAKKKALLKKRRDAEDKILKGQQNKKDAEDTAKSVKKVLNTEEESQVEMAEPGKIDASKKNGDWIQKAVNPKHKGYCTPMTKDTCTPARKALAKRFKKAARKEKKEGGTGWQGKV
jgi:hypothetical protein